MNRTEVTIAHEGSDRGGEYRAATASGDHAGELTWREGGEDGVRVATHTGVAPALRGQGIAEKLVLALVEDAKTQGFRIEPACSYVASQFRRHPEWSDLRA